MAVLCYVKHIKTNTLLWGEVRGGECCGLFAHFLVCCLLAYYWGCARGFGRGTLYMKWGQQNQRFGTMRLRGEKMKKREKEKKR